MNILQKEFRHIFRDYRTLLIIIGMPFAQTLIFGYAISTDIRYAPVAVLDYSHDVETARLRSRLFASGYFRDAGEVYNNDGIEQAFRRGTVKMVVVFGDDFARRLQTGQGVSLQLIADASEANTAHLLTGYAQAIVATFLHERMAEGGYTATGIAPEITMRYNPAMQSAYTFVPGIICLLLMLISCIMTSVSIAREKELGTMEALLASPLRPTQIIIGKVLPYLVIAFVIGLLILAIGALVFHIPVRGNLFLLLGECLLFILLALSIGILISTLTRTQQTAMMVSMFAMFLPTLLLSGFIYPVENMPWPLQWLSAAMPPRWFIIIIKTIMLKGGGLQHCAKETLILAAMTFVFLSLSIRNFNVRLK
ncbi:MAG: ABC transporter permease [Prevotellaceae bacterium]|nr:ABC transporter permease [Prevotellaceae bacterium]